MRRIRTRLAVSVASAGIVAASLAHVGLADSPPVGVLSAGPTSTIQSQRGQLVALALGAYDQATRAPA